MCGVTSNRQAGDIQDKRIEEDAGIKVLGRKMKGENELVKGVLEEIRVGRSQWWRKTEKYME